MKILPVLLTVFLLTGCTLRNQNIRIDRSEGSDLLARSDPAALSKIGLQNINLSGESLAPDITPPVSVSVESKSSKSASGVVVASARLVAVTDKDGKSIVGWRMVGEIANIGSARIDDGQMVVNLVTVSGNEPRTIIPDEVQPVGFIPLLSGERGVYDVVVSNPEPSSSLSVGFRPITSKEDKIRLEVGDLIFVKVPKVSEVSEVSEATEAGEVSDLAERSDTSYRFLVRGKLINNLDIPVKDLVVRYWAVAAIDGKEEVIAVGTWRTAQEVLDSGRSRKFELELSPLTARDQDILVAGKAGLLAIGMGKRLE